MARDSQAGSGGDQGDNSEAGKRRDEVLKRMLRTPPKPHKPLKRGGQDKPDRPRDKQE